MAKDRAYRIGLQGAMLIMVASMVGKLNAQTSRQTPKASAGPDPVSTSAPTTSRSAVSPVEKQLLQFLGEGKQPPVTLVSQAQALLESQNPQVKSALAELLEAESPLTTKIAICQALARHTERGSNEPDERFAEPLISALGTDKPALREAAVAAIGCYRSGAVPRRVGEVAAGSTVPLPQRLAALEALGRIQHEEAIDVLMPLLKGPDPVVSQRALAILREKTAQDLGSDFSAWQHWWEENRSRWVYDHLTRQVEALARSRAKIEQLGRELQEAWRQVYARTADGAREDLHLKWFGSPEPAVKLLAIDVLRQSIHDNKPVTPNMAQALRSLVTDPSPTVRARAAGLVGYLRDAQDVQPLLKQLREETQPEPMLALIRALRQIGQPSAIPALIRHVETSPPLVAAEAANALGSLGRNGSASSQAIEPAIPVLQNRFEASGNESPELQRALLGAMAELAHPAFLPAFESGIGHPDPALREAAVLGLTRLGNTKYAPAIVARLTDSSPVVRRAAAQSVGQLGTGVAEMEALLPLLREEEPEQVQTAAWTALKTLAGKLDLDAQRAFAERLRSDPARYVDLLTPVEQHLSQRQPAAADLADLREALGDARVVLGQHLDAEKLYEKAYRQLHQSNGNHARAAALIRKRVRCLLEVNRFAEAMEFAGRTTGNPDPGTANDVAALVCAFAQACLDRNQAKQVLELYPHVRAHLSSKIDREIRGQMDAIRLKALQARMSELLPALGGGDPARQSAEAAIRAYGSDAVGPLAAALDRALRDKSVNPAVERIVVDLLKRLAGEKWKGYDLNAPAEQKHTALESLLND